MYGNYYYHTPSSMYRQRITKEQAQEIALNRVPGTILHVDMDLENGVLVYEVFILTEDNRLFEVEILARSGRILKVEEEIDFD
ncbi:PepSY domain-containing protein [Neobacillus thermocopriae]|uniref:PepSY domain-containing protein n=2 Tax=Neobacillus thermocopriae TaxID=1215031 RepID=A0A6B3TSC8_9BACI|nr:PepSY domain-containing protein [Neobacillus thermocopriae]MED3622969.1 PepSY domain-containing protein [Neobacillus thermocopriae]MED3714864.1 PepSY domain-containing protein [Neobacillus thermocopriae]NEX79259.1 PepSY domain-containing protein [Neobacillus thermocopriae]